MEKLVCQTLWLQRIVTEKCILCTPYVCTHLYVIYIQNIQRYAVFKPFFHIYKTFFAINASSWFLIFFFIFFDVIYFFGFFFVFFFLIFFLLIFQVTALIITNWRYRKLLDMVMCTWFFSNTPSHCYSISWYGSTQCIHYSTPIYIYNEISSSSSSNPRLLLVLLPGTAIFRLLFLPSFNSNHIF